MTDDLERSLSEDATLAGRPRPRRSEVSFGDERTVGDGLSAQDTILDGMEVVDLEARYRVEGPLGQGGMGAVLLATDTRLARKVAIKRILGEAAGNRMAVNRFLTEAKSIAAINHQNIVQIYDYGRAADGPFLIMEYVDGGSLLDRCRDGALPLEDAVDLACHLCDGLAKAHDLGIIHRDIKPANVLLTKDGIPKLTDFGLAKAQAGDHGQTVTGAVLGTPDFMPPEQRLDASLVDHRSDLWSLAATVYQMVTGRNPKVIRLHELPQALQAVLSKALEDEKDTRYQSARELRDALKASLRAAAAAPAVVVSGEGQCPACGAQNDVNRKFCRGCGGPLEAPCLACGQPMPLWVEICCFCGEKQTPFVEAARVEMTAMQAKAEGLLGDYEFDEAALVAGRLRDKSHPRLAFLKPWAESFLAEIDRSRSHQFERAASSLAEALKHEEARDYESSIGSLEGVPQSLRSVGLPGMRETVAGVLGRVEAKQSESRRLEALVRKRIVEKAVDGLLPEVDRLLTLRPDRHDVQKVRQQLLERRQKQEAARDEAVGQAAALVERHDYDAALMVLSGVAPAAMTAEVTRLQQQAESLAAEANERAAAIRKAEAAGRFDGVLESIERYLELKPADTAFSALRESIVARQQAIESERQALADRAGKLVAEYRYQEAAQALDGMSPEIETPALVQMRSVARARFSQLEGLRGRIRSALADKALDDLRGTVTEYLRLKPNDGEATALLQKLTARDEEFAKAFQAFSDNVNGLLEAGKWQEALMAVRQKKPRPDEMPAWSRMMSKAAELRDARYREVCEARRLRDKTFDDSLNFSAALPAFVLLFAGGVFLCAAAALYFFPSIAMVQSVWAWSRALAVGAGILLGVAGMATLFPFAFRVPVQIVLGVVAYGLIVMLGGDRVLQQGFALACVGPWVLSILVLLPSLFANVDGQIQLLESHGATPDPTPDKEQGSAGQRQPERPNMFGFVTCPDCGVAVKPERLKAHRAHKCPARPSGGTSSAAASQRQSGWGEKACPRCGVKSYSMHKHGKCPSCGAG